MLLMAVSRCSSIFCSPDKLLMKHCVWCFAPVMVSIRHSGMPLSNMEGCMQKEEYGRYGM